MNTLKRGEYSKDKGFSIEYDSRYDEDLDYSDNIEMDFGEIPNYIQKDIKRLFNYDKEFDGDKPSIPKGIITKYDNWIEDLEYFVETIWQEIRVDVLKKAIDYGQECLYFHRENCDFCNYYNDCQATEIWKLRIVFAATLLDKISSGEGLPIFKKFYSNYKVPKLNLPKIRPIFKPELVNNLFDILKDFFSPEQQEDLKRILETGDNTEERLLFLGNGNSLADAFKQLYNANLITGCQKKELEKWISKNFNYRYRKEVKQFHARYLSDIISSDTKNCQNPLFDVKINNLTGEFSIVRLKK